MPASSPISFRSACGRFVFTLMNILTRKANIKIAARMKVVVLQSKMQGVVLGWAMVMMFWGSLLMQCGDVESNPGPGSNDASKTSRQTRLSVSGTGAVAGGTGKDVLNKSQSKGATMDDLAAMMTAMNSNMTGMRSEMTAMGGKMSTMSDTMSSMQSDVSNIKTQFEETKQRVEQLELENEQLKKSHAELLERVDDLENRSRRNNLLFYGVKKSADENCETVLKTLLSDNLDIDDDVQIDRAHRVGSSDDAPIIAKFTFYKDKERILKAKKKLDGTDIFIGEDYSRGVRAIRKTLSKIKKEMKQRNKDRKIHLVYDHMYVDGVKMYLSNDGLHLVKEKESR